MDKNIFFIQSSIHFKSLSCLSLLAELSWEEVQVNTNKQTDDCGLTGTGAA